MTQEKLTQEKLTLSDCFNYPKSAITNGFMQWDNVTTFIKTLCNEDVKKILEDDDFKLQLRSIDQLTNEEKEYIGKLRYQRLDSKNDLSIAGYNLWLSDSKIFEYLKEKGVCVNPEWFTNGKAVKDE